MRSCLRCIVLFMAVAACLLGVTALVTALYVGDWLVRSDEPRTADAIVVLAGAPQRSLYAADLFRAEMAPRVLVSRPAVPRNNAVLAQFGVEMPREEEASRRILVAKGVVPEAIEILGTGSTSTFEEMEVLRARFRGQSVRLLVVTSPLHTRRARAIGADAFAGTSVELLVVGTPYERLPERWWTDQDVAQGVVLEVAKTLFYYAGGRYRAMPGPAE
jgi:uncharacterized SAM-binding protein YcdF (DUF218 family)